MMHITLKNAVDKTFSQNLTRENMQPYYHQHNILWNQQRFDSNWPRYQNLEIHLNDQPIGIIRLSFEQNICYLREFQLVQQYQGTGIGSKLIDWLLARCREQRLLAVRLSVYTNNPARRLYARKGFEVKMIHQGMYRMQYRL